MAVSMMGARVRTGGVVALAMIAAFAIGCRTRPLVAGDSGTMSPDAGSAADATSDGAADQGEPRRLGESCDRASDCASGFCAPPRVGPRFPGICCNAACNSTCAWCDQSGTCVFVPDGERPVGTFSCYVDSAGACLWDGTCDGAGSCRIRAAGSICSLVGVSSRACDGDTAIEAMACDGKGACVPTVTQLCVPYTCDPQTKRCRTDCITDADCAGATCQPNGTCGAADAGTD